MKKLYEPEELQRRLDQLSIEASKNENENDGEAKKETIK